MPEESLQPPKISETDIIMKLERSRIEALTRRLETPIFLGHGMTEEKKLVAETISLD